LRVCLWLWTEEVIRHQQLLSIPLGPRYARTLCYQSAGRWSFQSRRRWFLRPFQHEAPEEPSLVKLALHDPYTIAAHTSLGINLTIKYFLVWFTSIFLVSWFYNLFYNDRQQRFVNNWLRTTSCSKLKTSSSKISAHQLRGWCGYRQHYCKILRRCPKTGKSPGRRSCVEFRASRFVRRLAAAPAVSENRPRIREDETPQSSIDKFPFHCASIYSKGPLNAHH